jgi:type VI secretion system secreted protein Hcp
MAQVDYFLKLEGIDGESTDDKHKGEIDLESWSWGESNSGSFATGGGGGAGKVVMQDFHGVQKLSKASPNLMIACATGQHIKKAVLTARKAGGKQEDYFTITMSDVMVSSYQTGGAQNSDIVPTDQFSINFSKIEFEYKEQKPDGSMGGAVKQGYDVKANKKV